MTPPIVVPPTKPGEPPTVKPGIKVTCTAGGATCKVKTTVKTKVGKKKVTLGSKTNKVKPGKTATPKVPLSKRQLKKLPQRRTVHATVTVAVSRPGSPTVARSAGVSFSPQAVTTPSIPVAYDMDRGNGFAPDPNAHARVGWLTALGLGTTTLSPDLQVIDASSATPKTMKVVAVMSHLEWNGGVGDPLKIQAYVSQDNALKLRTRLQSGLTTTTPLQFNYLVKDYDAGSKQWFTEAEPAAAPITTTAAFIAQKPQVTVDMTPVKVKDGLDVNVYLVTVTAAAPAGSEPLTFQNSPAKKPARPWGRGS